MILLIDCLLISSLHRWARLNILPLLMVVIVNIIDIDDIFRNFSLNEIEVWQNISWNLMRLINKKLLIHLIYFGLGCSPWVDAALAIINPFNPTLFIIISKITYLKGIKLFSFSFTSLHLEDQVDYLLNIGPLVGFDLGKDEHLIDKNLKSTQSWKEGLFLLS